MLKKIIACAAGLFIIAAAYGIFANNIDDETTVNGEHLGIEHVEVSDEITINTKTLKDYVSKTEKLITCEYYYSEIGDYEKSKPFLNFKLPFTTDKTLYTYSGKISAGINLKDLDFDVNASRKTITVKYPPVQILAHDMDQGFEFYDIKKVSGVTEINANTLIPYTNNDTTSYGNLKIYTAIERAGEKVFKHNNGGTPTTTGFISHDGIPIPFIYLPEPEITNIAIAYTATGSTYSGHYDDFAAQIHKHLNGVYVYLGWDNFVYSLTKTNIDENETTELGGKHIFEQGNELYVSNVNQPFLFSSTNTVDVDAQGIMAVQSAVKALSPGQYGQFPLYVFTEVGVWALEVASDGTFSAVKAVTNDVCINPKSITKLDTSVLYSTDRGIMMLSGSDSVCVSESIYTDADFKLITPSTTDTADLLPSLDNLISTTPSVATASGIVPFKTFLPDARMLYDYTHQRVIVYNPEKTYAYIYSLKSKQWGMMSSNIQYGINAYPECLAVDADNKIINLSAIPTNDTPVNGMLITRPLKLEQPDVLKTVDTIIQRGQFRKGHVKSILYGSRDLFHWHLVYSSTDHYLRGFRGTPYKYFRVVLLTELKKDESIFGCTVQFTPRLLDQPS